MRRERKGRVRGRVRCQCLLCSHPASSETPWEDLCQAQGTASGRWAPCPPHAWDRTQTSRQAPSAAGRTGTSGAVSSASRGHRGSAPPARPGSSWAHTGGSLGQHQPRTHRPLAFRDRWFPVQAGGASGVCMGGRAGWGSASGGLGLPPTRKGNMAGRKPVTQPQ